jgi:hypothetical protein
MNKNILEFILWLMWSTGFVFIVFKLIRLIEWDWLIVLSPLWSSFVLIFLIYIIGKVGLWIFLKLISKRKK